MMLKESLPKPAKKTEENNQVNQIEIPAPKPAKKRKKNHTQASDRPPKRTTIRRQQFLDHMIIRKKRQRDDFPDHPI